MSEHNATDNTTREQRRAHVLEQWRCLHCCEECGKCKVLRGRDPETLYTDYIEGRRSYLEVTLEIRKQQ
ncbi:MAG: hypothetical protein MJZ63_08900 [Muribaculaceae bacterium]|nr:hypothetical protein [Muribaculaceae bacterium]